MSEVLFYVFMADGEDAAKLSPDEPIQKLLDYGSDGEILRILKDGVVERFDGRRADWQRVDTIQVFDIIGDEEAEEKEDDDTNDEE